MVHYQGFITLEFDLSTCRPDLADRLTIAAPGINYLGKPGSFVQYCARERQQKLDASFTQRFDEVSNELPEMSHLATLDDFGPGASFDALNTFSRTGIKREIHRSFVETAVPLGVQNYGFGFVQYARAETGKIPRPEGD